MNMLSGTKPLNLERGAHWHLGVIKQHIFDVLRVREAATAQQIVATAPKRLRQINVVAAVSYRLMDMVNRREINRVLSNSFVLVNDPVPWRVILQNTKPKLHAVIVAMGTRWVTVGQIMGRLGADSKLSASQVGTALRTLKSLGLVIKSGKSDWCVTRGLDMPYTTRF